jgi:hemolysin III
MRSRVIALVRRAEADDNNVLRESRPEEWANAATHAIGAIFGLVALILVVTRAAETKSALAVPTTALYGVTLVTCFLASALFHHSWDPVRKRRLLTADHCAIFLVIAGTHTPITLMGMPGQPGLILLGAAWAMALAGIALRLFHFRYMHPLFVLMFFVMGWMGFVFAPTMTKGMGTEAVTLLLIGCLCHTGGMVFYSMRGIRFHHALWHVACLAGAVVHFIVIYDYILRAPIR